MSAPKNRRLATLKAVRLEMTAVYSDMRDNVIPVGDGSKLVYALGAISGVIEAEAVERRVSDLEKQIFPCEVDHGNTGTPD